MITIDKAIEKYKDIANTDANCPRHCMRPCEECVQECKQVFEWLEELKVLRELTRWSKGKRGIKLFEPTKSKKENREPIEYNGKTQTARQWSEQYNINYSTLIKRLDSGMDISIALTKPVDKRFRNLKCDDIAKQLKAGGSNGT